MSRKNTLSFTVPRLAPRNALALAARQRRAGEHTCGGRTERQRAERALRAELDRLRSPSP